MDPLRSLDAFVRMYAARVSEAAAKRTRDRRPSGVFVDLSATDGQIVPDMDVLIANVEELEQRLDRGHPMAEAALALMRGATDEQVAMGVLFGGGRCMLVLVQVHKAADL